MVATLRQFAVLLICWCALPVHAETWPAKPVRWLVPFPPGGASDITARILAEKISASWGQPVLIENRPGAGGTIATAEMVKSAPDGYTIMSGTMGTHAIAPNPYKGLSFEPARDLTPLTMVVDVPFAIAAPRRSAALPEVPTMAELGYPGFEATLWLGIFAPAGTPAPIVAKLSADIARTAKILEVKERLEGLGGEVVGMPHEEFAKVCARDLARWGKAVRELDIRID